MVVSYASCVFALLVAFSGVRGGAGGEAGGDMASCADMFNPDSMAHQCCSDMKPFVDEEDYTKQCMEKRTSSEWKCEDSECVMEKNGLWDGKDIVYSRVDKMLEEYAQQQPGAAYLVARVRQRCGAGRLPPPAPGACLPAHFQLCVMINALVACKKWEESDVCQEMSRNAEKCGKAMDKMEG